jgi:hypothetical protein
MSVYIHIGLHKTGTTYLQNNIFPKIENVHYVHLPAWRSLTKENLTEEELASYKTTLLDGWDNRKKLIISNEFFSGAIEKFTKKEAVIILDNLKLLFPEAQLMLVLRSPEGYLKSLYNFRVVSRGFCTKSMSKYYAENKKYLQEKFDYQFLINAISDRFSKCYIVKYEAIKDNNEYVAFVCKSIGVSEFTVSNEVKENTSTKKSTKVNAHLVLNRIFMSGVLDYFPENRLKNYLKIKYFNFKKTGLVKKLVLKLESDRSVMKSQNNLNPEQQKELKVYVKQYDEIHFS